MFTHSKSITLTNSFVTSVLYEFMRSYILDKVNGSIAAFSLRRLKESYVGPCVRVRESSLNAEQDIYFANDIIDTSALLSFVGSNDGFVVRWYDQSGNNANVEQSTAVQQPKIVSSGVLESIKGKPSLLFDGVDDRLYNSVITQSNLTNVASLVISKRSMLTNTVHFSFGSNSSITGLQTESNVKVNFYAGNSYGSTESFSGTDAHIFASVFDGSLTGNAERLKAYIDGNPNVITAFTNTVPALVSGTGLSIGSTTGGAACFGGRLAELFLFKDILSSGVNQVGSNIADHFSLGWQII